MTLSSARVVASPFGVHRYAAEHWQVLQPFLEGPEQDPKQLFFLTHDTWDLWPYARHGTPSHALRYRLRFADFRSFLKPYVKWYCYQQVLQRPTDLTTTVTSVLFRLRRTDEYLFNHHYTSLDDLISQEAFEDLWAALLPHPSPPFAPREIQSQAATRSFWLHIRAVFGLPLHVPPVAPCIWRSAAETGLDTHAVIPEPVIAQLTNILGLHREKKSLLNRYHHLCRLS